jgi:hypothetical protein
MPTLAKKPATTPLRVQLSATEFHQVILPPLSMPTRGPRGKLGDHRLVNRIFWVLYTGRPGKCLPVPKDDHDQPTIHDTTGYNVFAQWADDGAREPAFIASVRHLADQPHLDLSVLQGAGTNTVAPQGGDGLGDAGDTHQQGANGIAISDNHG